MSAEATLGTMRIVSLLPSATELLFAIGAGDLLVGRSHECDFPAGRLETLPILTRPRISADDDSARIDRAVRAAVGAGQSLYALDIPLLRSLAPDVILTQDLCAVCSIDLGAVRSAAAAMSPAPRIVSLNPGSISEVFDDMLTIGEAVNRAREARDAMVSLRDRYYRILDHVNAFIEGPEVLFMEWTEPMFVGGHWTPELITRAGGRYSLNPAGAPSRTVTPEEIRAAHPEAVIICPCGLSLERTGRESEALLRADWFRGLPAARENRIALVDGNQYFNRPGPRLIDALAFLVGWLNGIDHLIPADFAWSQA